MLVAGSKAGLAATITACRASHDTLPDHGYTRHGGLVAASP
jgi:hypothetical protein